MQHLRRGAVSKPAVKDKGCLSGLLLHRATSSSTAPASPSRICMPFELGVEKELFARMYVVAALEDVSTLACRSLGGKAPSIAGHDGLSP
jgi:hypothetical protein